jgi:hypothetical protein
LSISLPSHSSFLAFNISGFEMPILDDQRSRSEIEDVLENYDIILKEANKIDANHTSIYTRQLTYVIFKLYMPTLQKEVMRFAKALPNPEITGALKNQIEKLESKYGGRSSKDFPFLSPVVLLLKLAEKSDAISFDRSKEWCQPGWGPLASFRTYLQGLKFKDCMDKDISYWPGLPSCILSLVPVWWTSHPAAVISASNDRFPATRALNELANRLRDEQLLKLRNSCAELVQKRIRELETSSPKFKAKYEDKMKSNHTPYYPTEDEYNSMLCQSQVRPVHLPGILATWSPWGKYKPSCLLDYCRFRTLKPPLAESSDQAWESQKGKWIIRKYVYGTDSCAEWAAFLELASVDKKKAVIRKASEW